MTSTEVAVAMRMLNGRIIVKYECVTLNTGIKLTRRNVISISEVKEGRDGRYNQSKYNCDGMNVLDPVLQFESSVVEWKYYAPSESHGMEWYQ